MTKKRLHFGYLLQLPFVVILQEDHIDAAGLVRNDRQLIDVVSDVTHLLQDLYQLLIRDRLEKDPRGKIAEIGSFRNTHLRYFLVQCQPFFFGHAEADITAALPSCPIM